MELLKSIDIYFDYFLSITTEKRGKTPIFYLSGLAPLHEPPPQESTLA